MQEVPATASLALRLARWFDARLTDCPPLPSSTVRLYGLEVIDPAGIDALHPGAVRAVFVEEGPDDASILGEATMLRLAEPDAMAFVDHRWFPGPVGVLRPGSFPRRRRARVVRVFATTSAMAIRFDDDPEVVVFAPAA